MEKQADPINFKKLLQTMVRVSKMAWGDRKLIAVAIVLLLLFSSILPFVRSWLSGQLINQLVSSVNTRVFSKGLLMFLSGVIVTDLAVSAVYSVKDYLSVVVWHSIEQKFDLVLLKKRAQIDIASYEDPKLHDLFQNVREGGGWKINNMAERQFYLLQNALEVVIAGGILTGNRWWFAGVVVAGLLPELVVSLKLGEREWSITSSTSSVRRRYWQVKNHFSPLEYLKDVKLLNLADNFLNRIVQLFAEFKGQERANELRRLKYSVLADLCSQISIGVLLTFLVLDVVNSKIDIGRFTFLLTSIYALRQAVSGAFANIALQSKDSLYVQDAFKVLDLPPALPKSAKPLLVKRAGLQTIEFQGVSFCYPDTTKYVLKDINLFLQRGRSLAVVGLNGAGKTTLTKLLCRFYDPTEGQILVNGVDLRELNLEDFYEHLGVLFQDYAHYNFRVDESIGFGRAAKPLDLAKVKQSARDSEAEKFILEWKETYKQPLGREFTGGVEPSVGQWQKLALARLFYRNADLYILDEPTSSVDADSEAKIFENLESKLANKILVLISHRFSTVRRASEIVVLEGGRIVERGTHADLLKLKNGLYAKSFSLQAKGFE